MNRRDFLTLTAVVTLAAPLSVRRAHAGAPVAYTPGLVKDELAKGHTVFVDFSAPWCGTCAVQNRVMDKLRAANPAYEKDVTFVKVDWDTYRNDAFTKGLKVTDRATLIVLKGDKELGRLNWETGEAKIKALMDTALAAATSA